MSEVSEHEARRREGWGRGRGGAAITTLVALILAMLAAGACSRRTPGPVATVVVTAPVVETRVVEVTREVLVTATPVPIPTYVSLIASSPGTLTYPLVTNPEHLDPQAADEQDELFVVHQLYEGLFNLRADGALEPAAATGYVSSSDATVYTVTLRSGLTWSDGAPLGAQDYVSGVCRLLEPGVGSPLAYLLTDVARLQGAKAYAAGDTADCGKVGVRVVDDMTLQVDLEAPGSFLPRLMATSLFLPAPRDSGRITETVVVSGAVGTPVNGPFRIAERAPVRLTLEKNPVYWNAGQVTIERIEMPVAFDSGQQVALYEAGKLQVAEFPPDDMERIRADQAFAKELYVLVQPGVSYLGFNTQRPPTDDVNVRHAIARAIDRTRLIEQALGQPWHVAARSLIPPGTLGHNNADGSRGPTYDADAARRLLAEAGYGPDNPVPPVELWYNREGNNEAIFEAVADMLEEVGIPVRLVSSAWDVYVASLEACNASKTPGECGYNLYRMGWVLDYPDASSILQLFDPRSRAQYTGWQNERYGELLSAAAAEGDEAKRSILYREAEQLLLEEEAAVIPLMYYDRTVLIKDGITFEYPPFGPPNLQHWTLRE